MKKTSKIKRIACIGLVFLMSINSFAAIVSDNDGSAFVTKAEFDALKSSFSKQIEQYNNSIDRKIDGAIAAYLSGIKLSNFLEIENMYQTLATEAPGGKILWSSQTTCDYNKAQYTNLGFQFDIKQSYRVNNASYAYPVWGGINFEGYVFDWPIKNIITYGGEYYMTDDKASIDLVGDEICYNEYQTPISNYPCYQPQFRGDNRQTNIGTKVTTIKDAIRLCTTYSNTMMWCYDADAKVIYSHDNYYLMEPNNATAIYYFDAKPGYKTFSWPSWFKDNSTTVLTNVDRTWTMVSTDASVDDQWLDIEPDQIQTKHYGTSSDFPYTTAKSRMHRWGRTTGYYSWIDSTNYKNYSDTSGSWTTYYSAGGIYFSNYGDHVGVNTLTLKAPKDKYGIEVKMSEGFPVLELEKDGKWQFQVTSDKAGVLTTYNIGTGASGHTSTLVDTKTLAANAVYTVSGNGITNDVFIVKFLPTDTSVKAKLDVMNTVQILEN